MTTETQTVPAQETDPAPQLAKRGIPGLKLLLPLLAIPPWVVSLGVHFLALIGLAYATIPELREAINVVTMSNSDKEADLESMEPLDMSKLEKPVEEMAVLLEPAPQTTPNLPTVDVMSTQAVTVEPNQLNFAETVAPSSVNLMASLGSSGLTGVRGRASAMRGMMLAEAGGSKDSEAAVRMALKWLAKHQRPDGSWNFDHRMGPGIRLSPNPGSMTNSQSAATAIALLPFLGSGQTHLEGAYKENVRRGIAYLLRTQQRDGSWWGPEARMYSHGLAAMCICEAYAMTQDKALIAPVENSMFYIIRAQGSDGGWRYTPGEKGDTSVLGWNLMALKSGSMAGMHIPATTTTGASRFLDTVAMDQGAVYGYDKPGRGDAVTAIGLLSRMYLGWPHEQPQLAQGVQVLSKTGPAETNVYYNYYATQVMRHYGGDEWEQWNDKLRPQIVGSQVATGQATGSWFFEGDHGSLPGGRLYCTAMATMILEVYYRHMPIYGTEAADDAFPLLGEGMKKKNEAAEKAEEE